MILGGIIMDWKKERKIIKKYKLDVYSGSYNRLKQIMSILENFVVKLDNDNIEEYHDLKQYEKFVMKQYLNTNK